MPGVNAGCPTVLSGEELLDLAKQSNEYALSELLSDYEGFIISKASTYRISGIDRDDLVQEGKIGFIAAVKSYDPGRGTSFHSFALVCISSRMISAVRAALRRKHQPLNSCVSLDDVRYAEEAASARVINPEDMVVSRENLSSIKASITQNFTPIERKIFMLYLSGVPYSIMAKKLNVGSKFIDNALQRMKRKLSLA